VPELCTLGFMLLSIRCCGNAEQFLVANGATADMVEPAAGSIRSRMTYRRDLGASSLW
jgi:hypothetical protein